MNVFTTQGAARFEQIVGRNDVSDEAARMVLAALVQSDGTQAQFSHPDLGGMGQWSRGGMVMIGDMFNSALKARVDRLCTELSEFLRDPSVFKDVPEVHGSTAALNWWPSALGQPQSSGSQNQTRYAYFPEKKRLAIDDGGEIRVYDTGDHQIGGVSQQHGSGQRLRFQTQHGSVMEHQLALVKETPMEAPDAFAASETNSTRQALHVDDVVQTIEKLHDLARKGVLSDADFSEKKRELLARI